MRYFLILAIKSRFLGSSLHFLLRSLIKFLRVRIVENRGLKLYSIFLEKIIVLFFGLIPLIRMIMHVGGFICVIRGGLIFDRGIIPRRKRFVFQERFLLRWIYKQTGVIWKHQYRWCFSLFF